jgi:hypothetical protein
MEYWLPKNCFSERNSVDHAHDSMGPWNALVHGSTVDRSPYSFARSNHGCWFLTRWLGTNEHRAATDEGNVAGDLPRMALQQPEACHEWPRTGRRQWWTHFWGRRSTRGSELSFPTPTRTHVSDAHSHGYGHFDIATCGVSGSLKNWVIEQVGAFGTVTDSGKIMTF